MLLALVTSGVRTRVRKSDNGAATAAVRNACRTQPSLASDTDAAFGVIRSEDEYEQEEAETDEEDEQVGELLDAGVVRSLLAAVRPIACVCTSRCSAVCVALCAMLATGGKWHAHGTRRRVRAQ